MKEQPGSLWANYCQTPGSEKEEFLTAMNRKVLPKIILTEETRQAIDRLTSLAKDFSRTVEVAVRPKRCCWGFCRGYNKMFATIEQNELLLERNFDGKHFWVRGASGALLDCMFFPCSVEDSPDIGGENPRGSYLDKPTFIMCNPNALLYQQMVSSPNAYWLSFFLRRDVNVMCWNYRSYGKSKNPSRCCLRYCDAISPKNIQSDAEAVLSFLVNKLQVKGKIGVYGRSLGGIASTHLANNFPQFVSALIVDRSFCELDVSSERRLFGSMTKFLYRFVSFNWKASNDSNYIQASNCFKIVACDPLDEVIDN